MEVLITKEKVLVIQTAFLGDAILTLPMIQKLKEIYPNFSIDVLCIPSTSEIFCNSPFVDEVIIYDKKNRQKSIKELIKLIKNIRRKKYYRIYSPHRSFRTSLIVWLSKSKETFGFDNASLSFFYSHKIFYDKNIHEVARNLQLIGIDTFANNWRIAPIVKINSDIEKKIKEQIPFENKKFAAIAPGSVWATKRYPMEYYEVVVEYLVNQNYFIFFIGGNDDKTLCESLQNKFLQNSISFASKLSVIETITLLKQCSVLICNDSAPTHMGMAAQIPTLTIYCSTMPEFGFYPYNELSKYVSFDDLRCKPCGIHGHKKCPIKTFDCGYLLAPQTIIEKLKLILNTKKISS